MATRLRLHAPSNPPPTVSDTAAAYDAVGEAYRDYADGKSAGLFDFAGAYAYADREIWTRLEAELVRLRTIGRHAIRILDAGWGRAPGCCGAQCVPATWVSPRSTGAVSTSPAR